jgi:hypothetical protein
MRWMIVLGIGLLSACVPNNSGNNPPAQPAAQVAPVAPPKTAAIKAVGNLTDGTASRAAGQITLTDLGGGKARLSVLITGISGSTKHMGHIHVGTCAAVGPVSQALPEITTDASGTGASNAEIELARLPAQIYVAYHQRGLGDAAGIGGFIACVEIPR